MTTSHPSPQSGDPVFFGGLDLLGSSIVFLIEVILKPTLPHLGNTGHAGERKALLQKPIYS